MVERYLLGHLPESASARLEEHVLICEGCQVLVATTETYICAMRQAMRSFREAAAIRPRFDVFLCHNTHSKPAVKRIGRQLKRRGIMPWLDEWELRPGVRWQHTLADQIVGIRSAAVFIGDDGMGPWQNLELEAFLCEFVRRNCPVIPVILPAVHKVPELPVFLRGNTWVDFRKRTPKPVEQLVWGVTGLRPDASTQLAAQGEDHLIRHVQQKSQP